MRVLTLEGSVLTEAALRELSTYFGGSSEAHRALVIRLGARALTMPADAARLRLWASLVI